MSVGKKLKSIRVKHGLSQNEMTKRLNISQPVYSRYENDEKVVDENDDIVKRVAEAFNVSREWLLSTEQEAAFEQGTSNNAPPAEIYYTIPKDFMDAYFKQQQQTIEIMLKMFLGGGVNFNLKSHHRIMYCQSAFTRHKDC